LVQLLLLLVPLLAGIVVGAPIGAGRSNKGRATLLGPLGLSAALLLGKVLAGVLLLAR